MSVRQALLNRRCKTNIIRAVPQLVLDDEDGVAFIPATDAFTAPKPKKPEFRVAVV
jgi:hypothetical protein